MNGVSKGKVTGAAIETVGPPAPLARPRSFWPVTGVSHGCDVECDARSDTRG
ncbi:hypothetical protein AURDEDRAFT_111685 [Auricularia subglabra TFB-10046 SS5]|nr:hypothetical protein AURDEDRAFT_115923 [Auricularia subglabra TFB-10046 SS5]EJD51437.1 hypothetical protein AURDEDRAFT_111685 [Auricularia subglabra TFB-10046 SS5]